MTVYIPTTIELTDRIRGVLESALNQKSPSNEKAFINVLAGVLAMLDSELIRFAIDRAEQALVLTAKGASLELLGSQFGVLRRPAISAILKIVITGQNGTIIPLGTRYVSDLTRLHYSSITSVTIAEGSVDSSVICEEVGTQGNLGIGDEVVMSTSIPGANNVAVVSEIETSGLEEEDEESYRNRILIIVRNPLGGGNAQDYKGWSEAVAGVLRVYPYSGTAFGQPSATVPGDRTIYVHADSAVSEDGIAPQTLLDSVRFAINNDPDTGESRPPLGMTDTTLYVESVRTVSFIVNILNAIIPLDLFTEFEDRVGASLDSYVRDIRPYVGAVDSLADKNDTITETSLSNIVNDAAVSVGGSVDAVTFRTTEEPPVLISRYQMAAGEIALLATVIISQGIPISEIL